MPGKATKKRTQKRAVTGKRGKTAKRMAPSADRKGVMGLSLLALGVITLACQFIPSNGGVLNIIMYFLRGIGGRLCLLLPVLLCVIGLYLILGGEKQLLSRKTTVCCVVLFITIETIFQLGRIQPVIQSLTADNTKVDWLSFIGRSYRLSSLDCSGGGFLGAILCWPLYRALDVWGSYLMMGFIAIVVLMIMTGISFGPLGARASEVLDDLRVLLAEKKQNIRVKREQKAAERLEKEAEFYRQQVSVEDEPPEEVHIKPSDIITQKRTVSSVEPSVSTTEREGFDEEPFEALYNQRMDQDYSTNDYKRDNKFQSTVENKQKESDQATSFRPVFIVLPTAHETPLYIASEDEFVRKEEPGYGSRGFTIEEAEEAFNGAKENENDRESFIKSTQETLIPQEYGEAKHPNYTDDDAPQEKQTDGLELQSETTDVEDVEDSVIEEKEYSNGGQIDAEETLSERDKEEDTNYGDLYSENSSFIGKDEPGQEKHVRRRRETTANKSDYVSRTESEVAPQRRVIPELRPKNLDATPIVIPVKEKHEEPEYKEEYTYPSFDLLDFSSQQHDPQRDLKDRQAGEKLIETLQSFGVKADLKNCTHGPAITRYEIQPAPGVKVSRITTLADDIALNLAADGVRIEAPVPGKPVVGIEVPNSRIEMVCLRDVLQSEAMRKEKSPTAVALGKSIAGSPVIADMAKMPHVLIAGATGSGKSVCINTIIQSIIFRATPQEIRLILIDPKVVELSVYNGIPHLMIPVVTDAKKASAALNWAVVEMEHRYKRFETMGVRDIKGYNAAIGPDEPQMPKIIVIIDELADLMMVAPGEVEDSICRLAQLARAAGIHLVIATQRPSVNVITGVIKANIPSRIAFAVSSQIDSRTILDTGGAEKLLGKGDMLYAPQGMNKPLRVQGCFVSDDEVQRVVQFVKNTHTAEYNQEVIEQLDNVGTEEKASETETSASADFGDEMFEKAVELSLDAGQVSISMLQRRLRIGYARAGRLVDEMTEQGITAEAEGPTKPRKVLITREQWKEMQEKKNS